MMMIADDGLRTVVSGMRIAIVDETPNPGRTPINVPKKTPKKAITRFAGLNARANPVSKWFNASIANPTRRKSVLVRSLSAYLKQPPLAKIRLHTMR